MTLFHDGITFRQLGAAITAGLGALALLRPQTAASFPGVRPVGSAGVSELRATYGGFCLALGAFALFVGSGLVYRALGLAWAGAAGGRLLSFFLDGSRSGRNVGGIALEAALAALLLFL